MCCNFIVWTRWSFLQLYLLRYGDDPKLLNKCHWKPNSVEKNTLTLVVGLPQNVYIYLWCSVMIKKELWFTMTFGWTFGNETFIYYSLKTHPCWKIFSLAHGQVTAPHSLFSPLFLLTFGNGHLILVLILASDSWLPGKLDRELWHAPRLPANQWAVGDCRMFPGFLTNKFHSLHRHCSSE